DEVCRYAEGVPTAVEGIARRPGRVDARSRRCLGLRGLGERHDVRVLAPVVDVVDGATLPELASPYRIEPGAAAQFAADGHALVRGLANASEVAAYRGFIEDAAARASFERRPIEERDTYGAAVLQCVTPWR